MGRWGLWTHAELDAAGVPRSTVRDRVRRGAWERVLPGVFASEPLDHLGWCRAVALWRPDAVISHRSAASLWGLVEVPDRVDATVPPSVYLRTPEWLTLHRRTLSADAVTTGWGCRLVTPERALVDDVAQHDDPRVVDAALVHHLNPASVEARVARDTGSWGTGRTRRQLARWPGPVESEPERLLARALWRRRFRLEPGASVLRYRCDLLHRPSWTAVEVDGRQHHSEPAVFVQDRVRQNAIQRTGLFVARYAAAQVFDDVEAVADDVCVILRDRGRKHRPF